MTTPFELAALILADEPAGQLADGASIIRLLRHAVAQTGVTIVVASHDPNVHEAADLIFGLQEGRLVEREALRGEELFKRPERRG